MTDFNVDIKIDDSTAEQAVKRVTTELERNERAAKAAKSEVQKWADEGKIAADKQADAVKRLTREFANSEKAAEEAADKASALAQSIARVQVGQGFAGISAHFERVADVVERLHAPMREHIADVAALSTAYQSGLISAKEYTNEISRMRTAQQPGVGSGIASGLGLGVLQGGAAGVAAAATGKAMELGHDLVELGDAYTGLENRIKQVSRTEEEQGFLMERTRQIANASRADWNATGELYVRLTNATKEMGLSQGHVLKLTETIGKAFAQSGASSSEAAAGMLQLSQALASGKLQGDEFRSLAEAMPSLLDLFAQKLHVTRGALKEMGAQGKITSEVIVAAFDDASASIDSSFAKSTPTFSQSMTLFKNQMEGVFGPLLQKLLPQLGQYLTGIADRISAVVGLIERAANQLDKIPGGRSAVGKAYDAGRTLFDPTEQIKAVSDYSDRSGAELTKAMVIDPAVAELWASYADKFSNVGEMALAMRKEMTEAQQPVDTFNDQLLKLLDTTRDMPDHVARSERAWDNTFKVLDSGLDVLGQLGPKFDEVLLSWSGVDKLILPGLDEWIAKVTDLNTAHTALADGTATFISRYSVMLGNVVGDFAKGLAAYKAWDDTLNKAPATHKKLHDSWATSFVSPTLVELDMLIAKTKQWIEMQNEAVRQAGLRDLGAPQPGLAGGLNRQSDADNMIWNADQARFSRDSEAARAAAARRASFMGDLYSGPGGRGGATFTAQNQEQATLYTKRWTQELEKNKKAWEDIDKFGGQALGHIEDAMVQLVTTGKFSFKGLVDSILADLTRLATHRLLMSLLGGIAGQAYGSNASVFGTGATQSFQGLYGGAHAYGGSYTAPRTGGGVDSIPVLVHVSPGERMDFTPPGASPGGGSMRAKVVYNEDRRALLDMLDTPDGVAVLAEVHRKNPHISRRR